MVKTHKASDKLWYGMVGELVARVLTKVNELFLDFCLSCISQYMLQT